MESIKNHGKLLKRLTEKCSIQGDCNLSFVHVWRPRHVSPFLYRELVVKRMENQVS